MSERTLVTSCHTTGRVVEIALLDFHDGSVCAFAGPFIQTVHYVANHLKATYPRGPLVRVRAEDHGLAYAYLLQAYGVKIEIVYAFSDNELWDDGDDEDEDWGWEIPGDIELPSLHQIRGCTYPAF